MLRVPPLPLILSVLLAREGVIFCQKHFLHIIRWSCVSFLSFYLLIIVFLCFHVFNHPASGMKTSWSWWMVGDPCNMFFNSAWKDLLNMSNFTSIFIREIDQEITFFVGSLCGFGIRVNCDFLTLLCRTI